MFREKMMVCTECDGTNDITDLSRPYVVRTCAKCGRKIKLRPLGAHRIGLKPNKGDDFIIPAEFIKLSANPLKSGGQFTSYSLQWFAEVIFGVDIADKKNQEDFSAAIQAIMDSNVNLFKDAICCSAAFWSAGCATASAGAMDSNPAAGIDRFNARLT